MKKYKIKHIPKSSGILKTQDMSKFKMNIYINTLFQSHFLERERFIYTIINIQSYDTEVLF